MDFVLTLLTVPNRGSLDDRRVGAVRAALRDLGAETEAPNWLSPNLACDILFSNLSPDQAEAAAARTLEGEAVDFAAQALPGRRKKLLVADMDGTVVAGETLDELADFAGLKDEIAAITARAMNGEIDFNESLRERIALLKGLREDCLKRTCERLELAPGARELVRVMRRDGAYTALVSGGFTFFTKKIAERLRFHHQSGNTLDIERGVLTGKVVDPIVNRDGKLNTLIHLAAKKTNCNGGYPRRWRRRQRPADDSRRGTGSRLSRKARRRGQGAVPPESRGPSRTALPPGLYGRPNRSLANHRHIPTKTSVYRRR